MPNTRVTVRSSSPKSIRIPPQRPCCGHDIRKHIRKHMVLACFSTCFSCVWMCQEALYSLFEAAPCYLRSYKYCWLVSPSKQASLAIGAGCDVFGRDRNSKTQVAAAAPILVSPNCRNLSVTSIRGSSTRTILPVVNPRRMETFEVCSELWIISVESTVAASFCESLTCVWRSPTCSSN